MSLLVRRARLITVPSGTDDPGYIEEGWMLVGDDGRIDALGAGDPPTGTVATETLDVDGAFVAGAGDPLTVIDPCTEAVVTRVEPSLQAAFVDFGGAVTSTAGNFSVAFTTPIYVNG